MIMKDIEMVLIPSNLLEDKTMHVRRWNVDSMVKLPLKNSFVKFLKMC